VAEARRQERTSLRTAIDGYAADLRRRRIVAADRWERLLRKELLERLGNVPVATLDRRTLVAVLAEAEAAGLPGRAAGLRQRFSGFLSWCLAQDLIDASPLAGWRKPRASKAERIDRPGRALADHELAPWWRAVDASPDPIFRIYLRFLLLTGQRRSETAVARWSNVDLAAARWLVPATDAKNGRAHVVPLAPAAVALLRALPRRSDCDFVFFGRGDRPLSGFSKRIRPVVAATAAAGLAHWTLHDLRRTCRSGLATLGVPAEVAEKALNHVPGNELVAAYDRATREDAVRAALTAWAEHVTDLVEGLAAPARAA
jgi:integrase